MPAIENLEAFDRVNADSHFDALPLEAKHLIEMAVIRPFDDFDASAQARHNKGQELNREAEDAERSHTVAARSLGTNPVQNAADREYVARLERKAKAARKRHSDYMAKGGKAFEGMKPDAVFARIANRTFAKPHKLRTVTVPKGATLESVRKRMKEADAEIAEVMKRPKTQKEAREVLMAALERELRKNNSFGGIFESIFVRYRNGDPTQPYESTDMQLKLDNIMRAGIRGHMMAALDERLKSAFETRFDFENPIGRKERAKLISKLQAEIEDLEWVEGALIRAAVERGERVLLRPDTRNLSAVLNLEIDTDEIARREAAAKAAAQAA